ncbi:holo-[acyl-carrier protein] synthase [Alkalispirillum mobile]|uniref:Holo-[acyl-carrier-protein] synthase n=1 Tax=Alkalispirillum mobile TaxID=85925 RepID=A0A498C5Q5_9GAMM|nr:holo-ACP synthase [Alkalispirillum mobile]RLK50317.1 holo-[acyl-carrier protein] synthase [Alkalispirillum mobile]
MIIGVGTDLVEIGRMERMLARHGERALDRLLHPSERQECPQAPDRAARFLARRFAAKEAAAKALGTGIAGGIRFTDLQVDHDDKGRPLLQLHGEARNRARQLGVSAYHLSISDEQTHALAFVVLTASDPDSH